MALNEQRLKLSKRRFLQGLLATTVAGTGGLGLAAMHPVGSRNARLGYVVFDGRHSDSRLFADSLAAKGIRKLESADIMHLWHKHLRDHVSPGAQVIAGMTTATDLMVLVELAKEKGFQLRYKGIHRGVDASRLEHQLYSPVGTEAFAALLNSAASSWPEAIAEGLAHNFHGEYQVPAQTTTIASSNRSVRREGTDSLVSWIIA